MTIVRIAGLLRSGTNLMTWMLRNNFAAVSTATMLLGWKHGPIYRDRATLSMDDFVDPRTTAGIRTFVRDHPDHWARLTGSALFREAAEQQRAQTFAVALAVRDPALWYSSCLRVKRQHAEFLPFGVTPVEAAAVWNRSHEEWLGQLGERSVIVDTEALRLDPEPVLDRIATALRIERTTPVKTPGGYLHPLGQDELYDLLGIAVPTSMSREFTQIDGNESALRARFLGLLDADILRRLGLSPA